MSDCEGIARPVNPDPTWRRFLPRTGVGGMTGPLLLADGEEVAPGLAFAEDGRTGLWRDPATGYVWWVEDGLAIYRMATGGASQLGFSATNDSGSTIQAGQPVRQHTDGTLRLAQANSLTNAAVGCVAEQVAQGNSVLVVQLGPIELADWTAVIGGASLTQNGRYALVQGSAGLLDDSFPEGSGDVQQFIGRAVGTQTLFVHLEEPIQM